MNKLVAIIILIGGYALLWGFVLQLDKASAFMGNAMAKVTGKAQKALSDYRGNTLKRNYGLWRQGSLNTKFGKATQGLGVRIGAAQLSAQTQGSGTLSTLIGKQGVTGDQTITLKTAEEMAKRDGGRNGGNDWLTETVAILGKGATFGQAQRALANRMYVEDPGKWASEEAAMESAGDQLRAAQNSFGGAVGTDTFTLAATMASLNSTTSWRKGKLWDTPEKALNAARGSLKQLQDQNVITNTDAARIFTEQKARSDRAGAGFAGAMGFINDDKKGNAYSATEFLQDVVKGTGPGAFAGQRWETIEMAAPTLYRDLDATAKAYAADPNNPAKSMAFKKQLASADALYQVMSQVSPLHAEKLQQNLIGLKIKVTTPVTTTKKVMEQVPQPGGGVLLQEVEKQVTEFAQRDATVAEAAVSLKGDAEYATLRYDYGVGYQNQANSAMAAQQAAAAAAAAGGNIAGGRRAGMGPPMGFGG